MPRSINRRPIVPRHAKCQPAGMSHSSSVLQSPIRSAARVSLRLGCEFFLHEIFSWFDISPVTVPRLSAVPQFMQHFLQKLANMCALSQMRPKKGRHWGSKQHVRGDDLLVSVTPSTSAQFHFLSKAGIARRIREAGGAHAFRRLKGQAHCWIVQVLATNWQGAEADLLFLAAIRKWQ